jgi:diamine N-acetyltransferase
MTIKPCTPEDIPVLLKVSIQSYKEHYLHLWYDNGKKYIADNFNTGNFQSQLADKNVALFLIYDDQNMVAGFLKLNIDKGWENYDATSSLELERIYLINSVSGKGLGTKVLDFVTGFSKEKNKKYIWLKSMDTSSAVKAYERWGFKIISPWTLTFPEMKPEFRGMHVMLKEI